MGKKIILLFLLLLTAICFAQTPPDIPDNNSYAASMSGDVYFMSGNKIKLYYYEPENIIKTGIYTVDMSKGIPFIDVIWDTITSIPKGGVENKVGNSYLEILWEATEKERLLVLSNISICNIYNASKILFWGTDRSQNGDIWLSSEADKITASSYLKEGDILYSPEQKNFTMLRPLWVEGVVGNGIHEKLFITASSCFAIHVSIGFVSYIKPDLYRENSRPKRIRLTVHDVFSFDADLKDTPNYQTITLPSPLKADDILELEIIEVYSGTKHTDTCINDIYYDYIPWRPREFRNPVSQDLDKDTVNIEDKKETNNTLNNKAFTKNNRKNRYVLFFLLIIPMAIVAVLIKKRGR